MNKERISYLVIIIILLIVIGALVGKITSTSYKLSKLHNTVTKQATAIEQLEKQQNNTTSYTPKYLDSIPDYE